MRNKLCILLSLVLIVALTLAGCGGGGGGGKSIVDPLNAFIVKEDVSRDCDNTENNAYAFTDGSSLNIPAYAAATKFNLSFKEIAALQISENLRDDFRSKYALPNEYDPASSLFELSFSAVNASLRQSIRLSAASGDLSGKAKFKIKFEALENGKYVLMFTSLDGKLKHFTPIADIDPANPYVTVDISNITGRYIVLRLKEDVEEPAALALSGFDIKLDKQVFVATLLEKKFDSDLKITAELKSDSLANITAPVLKIKSSKAFDFGDALQSVQDGGNYTAEAPFPETSRATEGATVTYTYTLNLNDSLYDANKHPEILVWAEYTSKDGSDLYISASIASVLFTENTQPAVVSVSPDKNVAVNAPIKITFSEAMLDTAKDEIVLKEGDTPVTDLVKTWDDANTVLTVKKADEPYWENSTTYTLTVPATVKSADGIPVDEKTFTFVTAPKEPHVVSVLPDKNVAVNAAIEITFSEAMLEASKDLVTVEDASAIVDGLERNWSDGGKVLIINQPEGRYWTNSTIHTVTIPATVQSAANVAVIPGAFTFETVPPTPVVTSVEPADEAKDVPVNAEIKITFSEKMTKVHKEYIKVKEGSADVPGLERNWDNEDVPKVLTIKQPEGSYWANSTTYTIEVPATVQSADGIAVDEKSFTFAVIGTLQVAYSGEYPADNIPNDKPFVFEFSAAPVNFSAAVHMTVKNDGLPLTLNTDYTVTVDSTGTIVTVIPTTYWECDKNYTVTFAAGIEDADGKKTTEFTQTLLIGYFGGGNGMKDSPYIVRNAYHLANVSVSRTSYFLQTADIDLSAYIAKHYPEAGWLPIGDGINSFAGSYDGNHKKITGLWIERPTTDYVGLFGGLYGGTVKNLKVEVPASKEVKGAGFVGGIAGDACESTVTNCAFSGGTVTGDYNVGGIAGNVSGSTTVIDCIFAGGTVTGNDYVGGIAGDAHESTVAICKFSGGTVTGNMYYAGGIVGYASKTTLRNCTFSGGTVTGDYNVGGIAGYVFGSTTVTDCTFADGTVKGKEYVGGIVGDANEGSVAKCVFSGNEVKGNDYVGGIVGKVDSDSQILECEFSSTVTGNNGVGGIAGYGYDTATIDKCKLIQIYVTGNNNVGGIAGYAYAIKITNCGGNDVGSSATGTVTGPATSTGRINGAGTPSDTMGTNCNDIVVNHL